MPKAFEQEASQSTLCEKSTSLILKAIMAIGCFRGTVCACMDGKHFQILPEDVALRRGSLLVKKTTTSFKYFTPPNKIFNATSAGFHQIRWLVQNTCHWPHDIWKGCSLVSNLETLKFNFAPIHIHSAIKNKNNRWDRYISEHQRKCI